MKGMSKMFIDEKSNTGDGGKYKRTRTTSDETGGKSVSHRSRSPRVNNVWVRDPQVGNPVV
jgi:hypothetical protein